MVLISGVTPRYREGLLAGVEVDEVPSLEREPSESDDLLCEPGVPAERHDCEPRLITVERRVELRNRQREDYTVVRHRGSSLFSLDSTASSVVDTGPIHNPCPCLRPWPVIDPNKSGRLDMWDLFMASLLVIVALYCPFEAAYLDPHTDICFAIDRVGDAAFLFDMALQFFIAYQDPKNPDRLVKRPKHIVLRYLKGWFVIDLASVFPLWYCGHHLELIFGVSDLRIFRVLRLVRLLRYQRFSRLVDRFHTSFGFSYANLALAKFFVVVVMCCHWMACLWGGIALHWPVEGHSWLEALRSAKGGPSGLYEGPLNVYSISLYWALVTLTSIGYGDITPQTNVEYWAASVCASIMAAIWAYVIGAVCSIVSTMEPHEMNFRRTMDDLNWLMSDRCMPHSMCMQLRRYFHETREMNRQRVEREIIMQMSPKLQGEFALLLHHRWTQKVWYLRDLNHEVVVWAARHLEMAVYAPNEEVLQERTLFIVRRGICAFKGKILVSGDIWGDDMLLSNETLRETVKARSLSYLSVLMLNVHDLWEIVATFPEAAAKLRWAQVQIAVMRGVMRISKVVKWLETTGQLRKADLSNEKWMELVADILAGKFDENKSPVDYLGIGRVMSGRNSIRATRRVSRLSSAESCISGGSSSEEFPSKDDNMLGDIGFADIPSRSGKLHEAVRDLRRSMSSLSEKVDQLLTKSIPLDPDWASSHRVSLRSKASNMIASSLGVGTISQRMCRPSTASASARQHQSEGNDQVQRPMRNHLMSLLSPRKE